jgi:hypothetical protein
MYQTPTVLCCAVLCCAVLLTIPARATSHTKQMTTEYAAGASISFLLLIRPVVSFLSYSHPFPGSFPFSSFLSCLLSLHSFASFSLLLQVLGTGEYVRRAWYDASSAGNPYVPATDAAPTTVSDTVSDTGPGTAAAAADAGGLTAMDRVTQQIPAAAHTTSTSTSIHAQPVPEIRKFAPRTPMAEPGAVLCRVARSFLRFGHLELFAQRGEKEQLLALADYVCFREFPHLLCDTPGGILDADHASIRAQLDGTAPALAHGSPARYVSLYRCIALSTAELVAQWMRVGYVQGNMNSDNTLLGGRTVDYGPFGFLEKYQKLYQPFTGDSMGNFAFSRQPEAMRYNLEVLGTYSFS